MDEMSSTDFRERYAKLTEPTIVTVLGRQIGTWTPYSGHRIIPEAAAQEISQTNTLPNPYRRPFTPAPKPGKR